MLFCSALTAGNTNSVLFLSTTVGSLDTGIASGLGKNVAYAISRAYIFPLWSGYTVDIATPAIWATMTASDFGSFRALFLGDPNCITGSTPIAYVPACL